MGKKTILFLAIAIVAMVILPATAFGAGLINEYGMHYAGQSTCTGCHGAEYANQVHGRFAKPGLFPAVPEGWAVFRGPGNPPQVPGTAGALWDGGGEYSIAGDTWVTLGDTLGNSGVGNSGGEYLFFKRSSDPTVMPWNLVEGLASEPSGAWLLADGEPKGLYDVGYSCQRCHQLGSTVPKASATVPNPAATVAVTATTARQWARPELKTVNDFMTVASVSYAGLGIQCENCHGTGVDAAAAGGGHMGSGTQVSTSLETLGQSQVCGQCHGSFTDVAGTVGIYGYTTNLPLRNFVDVNGVSSGQSYTKIPTVAEFMATPKAYWMFPNGSNAKGGHYYYDEWSASAHSYRGALTKDSADAMTFQKAGNGHYSNSMDSNLSGCYKCHTGEGYLKSKDAAIAKNFTPASDNIGKMGQECITCHNGHPSAVGAANVVRQPDPAGVRSATGLSKANDSICEDCHNWQYEVLGTKRAYAPLADLSAHADPSHPQRETLEGRSMVEVPRAGKFMPGAKCEDCHMPKTNNAANRISHGMKPMLPGDAATWMTAAGSNYQGQDSCSKCHVAQTRSELQANIDKWQADATAQAKKAAAAITAAQTRKEYSLTNKTKPGYVLVGKATWNYKVFANDASSGVHNPQYIVAGLVKARELAKSVGGSFKSVAASKVVKRDRRAFVWGKVVNGDRSAAANATLALYKNGKATGKTVKVNANGTFAFSFVVKGTARRTVVERYTVRWLRSSERVTRLTSATVRITVKK